MDTAVYNLHTMHAGSNNLILLYIQPLLLLSCSAAESVYSYIITMYSVHYSRYAVTLLHKLHCIADLLSKNHF